MNFSRPIIRVGSQHCPSRKVQSLLLEEITYQKGYRPGWYVWVRTGKQMWEEISGVWDRGWIKTVFMEASLLIQD